VITEHDQLALVPGKPAPRKRAPLPLAEALPIAQVRIDTPVPHLDKVFDYQVPEKFSATAVPGVRVRVRFAGRLVDGFIVGRAAVTSTEAALRPLERVISPEIVLTPEISELVSLVADRYAGTFSDVVRSAVPPRHARAESMPDSLVASVATSVTAEDSDNWSKYAHGATLLDRVAQRQLSRWAWSARPAHGWAADIAALVRAAATDPAAGVLVIVPDRRAIDLIRAQFAPDLDSQIAVLAAEAGPERRYRDFLRVLRRHARIVIGTRSAVFAPVADLRLIIVWDDADESMIDPHAPYWHARDVAVMRAHQLKCSLAIGSAARSIAAQNLCESGWARSVVPLRAAIKADAPVIRALQPGDERNDAAAAAARIPHTAWLVAKEGLRHGPVLIQVPRRGHTPALACQDCRQRAVCECGGPLALSSGASVPSCTWCAKPAVSWKCPQCRGTSLRAVSIGVERTAEEFGRAFSGARVRWSSGETPITSIDDSPALIVSTPGVEPIPPRGYAAVLLLDARAQLEHPSVNAAEEAVMRWFTAAALARPSAHVVVTAESSAPAVQALIRWDAPWFARHEYAQRLEAGLPPATRMAALRGTAADIAEVSAALSVPHRLLGPNDQDRAFILVSRENGLVLSRELRAVAAVRSARREAGVVQVVCDPRDLSL
jgi:primosomal protein N' (replication factor Y)